MLQQSPITQQELLKRQLLDWQRAYADLAHKAETSSVDLQYAQNQIDRLTDEVAQLPG